MMQRRSFIEEASQKVRESEQTLNIVFLEVVYVLYCSSLDDREHQERMQTGKIDQIKTHPKITEKIPSSMLETLDKYDLSAVLGFSTKAVENLCRLCDENNAKIVIASSWGSKKNLAQLKALFFVSNFGEYILDSISDINAKKVEKWLVDHSAQVNSFVILDGRDSGLSNRFSERYVHCNKLLSDDSLLYKATNILGRSLQFENSTPKLFLDAIEKNSSQVTHVEFKTENMSALKMGFGWDTQTLMNRLFSALEQNQFITHLTLQDFYQDECDLDTQKKLNADLLGRIAALLLKSPMKLEYLNIAHNKLGNFNALLAVLDGHTLHIPHVCFNANPLGVDEQKTLAEWMKTYPTPIRIDLDLSGSGWGRYPLDGCIINAVEQNKNIHIYVKEDLISAISTPINQESLSKLISSGRIELAPKSVNECRMQ